LRSMLKVDIAMSTFDFGYMGKVIDMIEKVRLSGPTLQVLKALLNASAEGLSGADISKSTRLGSGTMYPLLQRLEGAGWIRGAWENIDPSAMGRPARKLYKLTPAGHVEASRVLAEFQMGPGELSWA